MFGSNLTSVRAEAETEIQEKFSRELRKLIGRYTALLDASGLPPETRKGNRTILAKVRHEHHVYLLVRAPLRKESPLSPRQKKIALLVAQGLTNKEIAKRLKIKPNGVTAHLTKIFLKLDIHSRVALARHFLLTA